MKENRDISWTLYSWGLIGVAIIFQLLRWRLFPMFMDIYYHLSVMLGFDRAGGYVATDFLQYAPVGRPHLYPPLLHLAMLAFYKLGFGVIFIARFFTAAAYPCLLAAVWLFSRLLFNKRFAFWTVVLSASSYYFYLETSILLAFSLALVLGMSALLCLEKNKTVSAVLLFSLVFYAHSLVGYLFLLSVLADGLLNGKLKLYGLSMVAVLFFSSPIIFLQVFHRDNFSFFNASVQQDVYVNIPVYLFAGIGIAVCRLKKGRYRIPLVLFIGFFILAFGNFRNRFFSAQAMLPIIFLGAAGIETLLEYARRKIPAWYGAAVLSIFIVSYIFSPTVFFTKDTRVYCKWVYSVFSNLLLPDSNINHLPFTRAMDASMYVPKFIDPLVAVIRNNSTPDDIVYADIPYAAGMLSVLSGRAISCGMLPEVGPFRIFDQIKSAKLLVWFTEADGTYSKKLKEIADSYGLQKIAETDVASVYRNPSEGAHCRVPRPFIPVPTVFVILLLSAIAIAAGIVFL